MEVFKEYYEKRHSLISGEEIKEGKAKAYKTLSKPRRGVKGKASPYKLVQV
jgi:hypothetical protein